MSNRFVHIGPSTYTPVTEPLELIKESLINRRKLMDLTEQQTDSLDLLNVKGISGTDYEKRSAQVNKTWQGYRDDLHSYISSNPSDYYGQARKIREIKQKITKDMVSGEAGAITNAYNSYSETMKELMKDAGKKDGFTHKRLGEADMLYKMSNQDLGAFNSETGNYENARSFQNPVNEYDLGKTLEEIVKNTPQMEDYTVTRVPSGQFDIVNKITGEQYKDKNTLMTNLSKRLLTDEGYTSDLNWKTRVWAAQTGTVDPNAIMNYQQTKYSNDVSQIAGYAYKNETKPNFEHWTDSGGLVLYKHKLAASLVNQQQQQSIDFTPTVFDTTDPTVSGSFLGRLGHQIDVAGGILGYFQQNTSLPGSYVNKAVGKGYDQMVENSKDTRGRMDLYGSSITDEGQRAHLADIALSNPYNKVTIMQGGVAIKTADSYKVANLLKDYGSQLINPKNKNLYPGTKAIGVAYPSEFTDNFSYVIPLGDGKSALIAINDMKNNDAQTNGYLRSAKLWANSRRNAKAYVGQSGIIPDGERGPISRDLYSQGIQPSKGLDGYEFFPVANSDDAIRSVKYKVKRRFNKTSESGFIKNAQGNELFELPSLETSIYDLGQYPLKDAVSRTVGTLYKGQPLFWKDYTQD